MAEEVKAIPILPCPHCKANLLDAGFHNTCTETVSLREDNYTNVFNGRLYIDHDEDNHETIEHVCEVDAFCRACDKLLPWPLYEIRRLDGVLVGEAPGIVTELLAGTRPEG